MSIIKQSLQELQHLLDSIEKIEAEMRLLEQRVEPYQIQASQHKARIAKLLQGKREAMKRDMLPGEPSIAFEGRVYRLNGDALIIQPCEVIS